MIINVLSDEPEDTGLSPAEMAAVKELMCNELFQRFCRGQHRAILIMAARDINPYKPEIDDAAFRSAMQKIHGIASFWLQLAEAVQKPAD